MKVTTIALPAAARARTDDVAAAAHELLRAAISDSKARAGAVLLGDEPQPRASVGEAGWTQGAELRELACPVHEALWLAPSDRSDALLVLPLQLHDGSSGSLQLSFECAQPPRLDLAALTGHVATFVAAHAAADLYTLLQQEKLARTQAETALRETTTMLVKHQQVGKMGDFRFNTRTGESFASLECYKLFGLDPALKAVDFSTWSGKILPEDRQRTVNELQEAVAELRPMDLEYRILLDGSIRRIQCRGEVDRDHQGELFYYGVLTDVTERRATEAALRRQQAALDSALRFASLGELAGAIIHEINQPLTAIAASAEACVLWLERAVPDLDEAVQASHSVVREVRRAVGVVDGLKSLVRGTRLERTQVQINDVVRDVLATVSAELELARITTQLELDPLPTLSGDLTQLQQAIFNLVRNAIDVLQHVDGRERLLTIRSSSDGSAIRVSISDVGAPISPDQLARLFDSFFTTKVDGLGFGLSITRKIIVAHGGRIWAEPNEVFGLTMNLTLPVL
jgi:two-component system, LuxR family, sensor kinase FixL